VDKSTMRVWGASVGVSFALGFGVAWTMRAPEPAAATPALAWREPAAPVKPDQTGAALARPGQAPALPVATLPNNASVDELWARALAPQDRQQSGYDAEDRLRKLAHSDPVALRSLLQRYDGAPTPQARELLKSVLSTVQKPDVVAFATRLANSSSMAERKYGFELLQGLAPDASDTRNLVKHALATEQSPEVLVQALAALKSGVAGPEESEQIVAQLKILSEHADPAVRSHSILLLGQWDKKGEGADHLSQALADRAPEVRQAAIFAIAQAGVRSDAVKVALMGLLANPQESNDVRGSALQALERFSLSKEEYASFTRARAQMLAL
jgi:hypothetical protein